MRTAATLLILAPIIFLAACQISGSEEEGLSPEDLSREPDPTGTALLWLPNRVLDLLEIVRFGIDLGPGYGADLELTSLARFAGMQRDSLGIGWQGLRRWPVTAGHDQYHCVGPATGQVGFGYHWYRGPADLRLELHPLLLGFNVALDLSAAGDFLLGIFTLDPEDDDLVIWRQIE
jgi:hypothetical protein